MTTLLLTTGIPVGYLIVGLLAARSQSVRIFRWRWDVNVRDYSAYTAKIHAPVEAKFALAGITLLWPLAIVVLVVIGALRFVMAPVQNQREKAEQLRTDAEFWSQEARNEDDPEKRRMARELSKSLREQAEGMDIR